MVIGASFGCFMDVLVKLLAVDYSVPQIIFIRTIFALSFLWFFFIRKKGTKIIKTKRYGLQIARGIFSFICAASFFYSITLISLAEATTIYFSCPFIVCALSVPLLNEKVGYVRLMAIIIGFFGVILVLNPKDFSQIGGLFAFICAVAMALSQITARLLSSTEKTETTTTWSQLTLFFITLAIMPYFWTNISTSDIIFFAMLGLFSFLSSFYLTHSVTKAPVAIVAPFDYICILWAVFFDILLWDTQPSINVLFGALLICGSGLFILYRELYLERRRAT